MIKAIYKRKGRKWSCQVESHQTFSVKVFTLLARAGISFTASVFQYRTMIAVRVTNALGLHDFAEFKLDEQDKAKAFLYSRSRDASPQLSLFWGAM